MIARIRTMRPVRWRLCASLSQLLTFSVLVAAQASELSPRHGSDGVGPATATFPGLGRGLESQLDAIQHGAASTGRISDRSQPSGVLHSQAATKYTLVDLGPALAHGVNDRTQVVGLSSIERALLWDRGSIVDLGIESGWATDINSRGQIVGFDRARGAFLWEDGVTRYLEAWSGRSNTVAINGRGQVVGTWRIPMTGGTHRAFLWQDGSMTDLGTLGGQYSFAMDINDNGQVVGGSETATGEIHAFLWQAGAILDLGTLGGCNSVAAAINNRGQVVGNSNVALGSDDVMHAFLWQHGVMMDLGALELDLSSATGINDRGQVVGATALEGVYTAFIWEDGVMSAVEPGSESFAYGINNKGEVVGQILARTGDFPGYHAALWLPAGGSSGTMVAAGVMDRAATRGSFDALPKPSTSPAPALAVRSPVRHHSVRFELRGGVGGVYKAAVYDVKGRLVRQWAGLAGAGAEHVWDGRRGDGAAVAPGVYFLRVRAEGEDLTAKLVIVR